MIRTTLVIGVLVGLVGCVGPKPYTLGKVFQAVPPPQPDMAQVVFYYAPIEGIDLVVRDGGILEISEDDVVVSGLKPQTYTLHDATPGDRWYYIGRHFPSIGLNGGFVVNVQAGKTYYARYTYAHFVLFGLRSFDLVPEAVALEELETLRQLRFHKELYAAQ